MTELFRGYVKTRNKKCTQKFANGETLLTLDEAQKLDEYAGILAEDTILIDIDDADQSETLMKIVEDLQIDCKVIDTTRGKHFYFRNTSVGKCYTGVKLACGLTADIKIGSKNTYAILKFKGEERFCEWDREDESKPYADLPKWLEPVDGKVELYGMDDGDGRNQALFNHILTLSRIHMNKSEIQECLNIINKYVFRSPLPKKELKTILRDESFPEEKPQEEAHESNNEFFTSKGQFLFDKFAKYLLDQYKIVKINGQLHIFKDGVYVLGEQFIEAEMIRHISSLNQQKRKEVLSYLSLLIREDSVPSDANFIAFRNGIFSVKEETLQDFDPNIIITNKIDHDYNKDAYSEIADRTLDKLACGDVKIRALLEEVIGYCFYRRNELRKAFVLTSGARGGKSTFLDMIIQVLGDGNTTALDLNELGDRFKTAELFGKLANVGDDIGDEFIPNPAVFKKVVSGDRVNAERKGKDPFDFACYAKQLFSANSIPRIKDKSGAVIDRLVIVPFDAVFSKDDPDYDPYIKYKLRDEDVMEYLVRIGIEGLKRVLENQSFTSSEKVTKNLEEYEESNNPILLFFKEITEDDVLNNQTNYVYQRYAEFCIANSFQQLSNIEFSKQIKKFFDCDIRVKSLNGKSVRIFTRC